MWRAIFTAITLLFVAAVAYVVFRVHRFSPIQRLARKHRVLAWLTAVMAVAAIELFALINQYAVIIVFLHLFAAMALCDFVAFVVRKKTRKKFGYDAQNIVAIALTAVYLGAGWFFAHHVYQTEYTFYTQKEIGADLRVVEIADVHLGKMMRGKKFAEQMKRVQATNPDVVVIAGDFVDIDTEKADVIEACRALGELETRYGVYYIFGNHDEGYYHFRDFTGEELRDELTSNGVKILEDESVLIDDRFYIVGRHDKAVRGRASIEELTSELDRSKYTIVLDHQPNDYANEAAAKVDLVLSGHTHGGHIFPAGFIGVATGINDFLYGTEKRDETNFVVSSGIAGWAIPFKTGAISEYVVIDIRKN